MVDAPPRILQCAAACLPSPAVPAIALRCRRVRSVWPFRTFPSFIWIVVLIAATAAAAWAWQRARPASVVAAVAVGICGRRRAARGRTRGSAPGVPRCAWSSKSWLAASGRRAEQSGRRLPEDDSVRRADHRRRCGPTRRSRRSARRSAWTVQEIEIPCPRDRQRRRAADGRRRDRSRSDRRMACREGRFTRPPSFAARRGISIPACRTRSVSWRGEARRSSERSRAARSSRWWRAADRSPRRPPRFVRSFAGRSPRTSVAGVPRAAAIVAAIVIGDRAGLDNETERRLQEAGTYHVIAISGGNIAILAGLTLGVFRIAGLLGRSAMLSAIAGLIALRVPRRRRRVGRSRDADGRRVLRGARDRSARSAAERAGARRGACWSPPIRSPSPIPPFCSPSARRPRFSWRCLRSASDRLPKLVAPLVAMLAASVAAEAALFPIAAFVFSRVTVAGLVLNFAAIPLMAVTQIAGMVARACWRSSRRRWPPPSGGWRTSARKVSCGRPTSCGSRRRRPGASRRRPGASSSSTTSGLVGRRAGRGRSGRRHRARSRVARAPRSPAFWILAEPWAPSRSRGDGRLHVTFIDVGQGDAAFVRFPGGATLLVDAGGLPGSSSFDVGDRVVGPVLRQAGVRRLDTVALTHGDADHIGGARLGHRGVPAARCLGGHSGAAVRAAAAAARPRRGHRRPLDERAGRRCHGDRRRAGRWCGIRGCPTGSGRTSATTTRSCSNCVWRDVSVVLTGDIGREVEETDRAALSASAASRRQGAAPRQPDVEQRGRSSARWRRASPSSASGAATRSVTRRRRCSSATAGVGAEIFRTDRDGAVTVDTDGHSMNIRTFTGRVLSVQ